MCSPSAAARPRRLHAEVGGRLGGSRDRPHAHVFSVEQRQPLFQRLRRENVGERGGDVVLVLVVLPVRELGPADELAEPREEPRLERGERQPPSVAARIDRVAGEAVR